MRHSRRKNVIGQHQKEPEPKLHTHSSSPRIYTNDSITFLTTIYTLLINVLARSRLHSIIVLHTLAAPFGRRNRVITVKK